MMIKVNKVKRDGRIVHSIKAEIEFTFPPEPNEEASKHASDLLERHIEHFLAAFRIPGMFEIFQKSFEKLEDDMLKLSILHLTEMTLKDPTDEKAVTLLERLT